MLDLVATPRNPIPPGARVYALNAADNVSLRMARFSPPGAPRATVALFQGRAEFIEKYFETIDDLLARGFEVVTLDWRGQGGSERELANPRKGHVDDFAQYQRDLSVFLAEMTRSLPKALVRAGPFNGRRDFARIRPWRRRPFRAAGRHRADDRHSRLRFPRGARLLANTLDMLGLGAMFIPGGREASLVELKFEGNILTSDPARLARNAAVLAHGRGWESATPRSAGRTPPSARCAASRRPTMRTTGPCRRC